MRCIVVQTDSAAIKLPCPLMSLVRLAGECSKTLGHDDVRNERAWLATLISNPSLLIVTAAEFKLQTSRPLESLAEFDRISDGWVARAFSEKTYDRFSPLQRVVSGLEFENLIGKYCVAKTRKKFVKALVRFVIIFNPELKKRQVREWLESLFAESWSLTNETSLPAQSINGDQGSARIAREDILGCWMEDIDDLAIDPAVLFRAADGSHINTKVFESDLRQAKLDAMKELAYGASHEINNPLANIATRAQTLLLNEAVPDKRHWLGVIYEQAMRAHEMISDLMLFARPPAASFAVHDLSVILKELFREMAPEARGIKMLIRQYPDVEEVEVDPSLISVAFKAIARNSIEAIDAGDETTTPEIRARLFRYSEKEIGISFVDSGPGIPDEIAANVFDPFYSGREAGRGLGFGLSKAWRIIGLHSGSIVHSTDIEGRSQVLVTIPIRQSLPTSVPLSKAA